MPVECEDVDDLLRFGQLRDGPLEIVPIVDERTACAMREELQAVVVVRLRGIVMQTANVDRIKEHARGAKLLERLVEHSKTSRIEAATGPHVDRDRIGSAMNLCGVKPLGKQQNVF